jgi:hypothetical protein
MLAALEERIMMLIQEYQERIRIISVKRNTQDIPKTSVVVDMESPSCLGRVTCWDSGECDIDVIHSDTDEQLIYKYFVVAKPTDLDPYLAEYIQAMLNAE